MKPKRIQVADFRQLFAGKTLYRDLLPAIVGLIMVQTKTTYASTMRAVLSMDGRFAFSIIDLPRTHFDRQQELLIDNLGVFEKIIMVDAMKIVKSKGIASGELVSLSSIPRTRPDVKSAKKGSHHEPQ